MSTLNASSQERQIADEPGALGGKRLALGLLFAIALMNYIDRTAFAVLQVPIKSDLGLSDGQVGLLAGLCFILPYTILSIPAARLADLHNRKRLILSALVVWSAMTALTGLAKDFAGVATLRMGVAIGEACCLPAAYSLLADYFPLRERGRATAFFGAAFPLGAMLGLSTAGLLADQLGWRGAFAALGAAGLATAPVLFALFREPPRADGAAQGDGQKAPALLSALSALWRMRAFRYIALAASCQAAAVQAVVTWTSAFYVRVHHLPLQAAGVAGGLMIGLGGLVGMFLGGASADRLSRRGRAWYVRVPLIACAALLPAGAVQMLVPDVRISLAFGFLAATLLNVFLAPTYAITQSLAPPRMRALASAVIVTATAIVGGTIGPFLTGWLSDSLSRSPAIGPDSLRYAILAALTTAPAAAAFYAIAARHLEKGDS